VTRTQTRLAQRLDLRRSVTTLSNPSAVVAQGTAAIAGVCEGRIRSRSSRRDRRRLSSPALNRKEPKRRDGRFRQLQDRQSRSFRDVRV